MAEKQKQWEKPVTESVPVARPENVITPKPPRKGSVLNRPVHSAGS